MAVSRVIMSKINGIISEMRGMNSGMSEITSGMRGTSEMNSGITSEISSRININSKGGLFIAHY